jgi:hypothetical protein
MKDRMIIWGIIISNKFLGTPLVEKKLVCMIVEFAKHSCNNTWPSYFMEVNSLLNGNPVLCLDVLELTLSEFTCFDSPQFRILSPLIHQNIGSFSEITLGLLKDAFPILTKIPSPNSTYRGSPASHISYINSPRFSQLFGSPQSQSSNSITVYPSSSGDMTLIPSKCLEILQKLFELNYFYDSPYILEAVKIVFDYANVTDDYHQLGMKSLIIIEEFMAHNYLPDSGLDVAVIASDRLLELLSNCNELLKLHSEKIDEDYIFKILNVINLFCQHQLPRLLQRIPNFPIVNLFEILYLLMEMLDGVTFNSVVPIWEHIVDACNSAKIEKFIPNLIF